MNENQEVSIKFINTITGDKKLQEYEQRLEKIYAYISSINAGQKVAIKEVKNAVNGLGKEVEKTKDKTNDFGRALKSAFNVAGIVGAITVMKKLMNTFGGLSKKSSDYIENLNLLEVAYANIDKATGKFNESIEESSERIETFINKMADVYGFDESNLTRQFGIFKQLANAMQLPTETAENLSELMVKMSNDISSLYNLDLSRASNALQSALAGQVRPIRTATGADITEKTLQSTVDALGLDRSISQLSYVEKRLIMVISLTDQLKKSQGDWGRTIESVANQTRIMKEQWSRLGRAIGNVFYPIIEKVLPYLNAMLMVLTEIFNLVASLIGFEMPKFDYSGLAGVSDETQDIIDGMNDAGNSADELNKKMKGLRGFDKLNVVNTPTSNSKTSGSGIDPAIMEAFTSAFGNYNDMMDEVNMKARQIRDNILDWLGFTDGTYRNLKLIAGVLGTIAGLKILSGLTSIYGIIKKLFMNSVVVKALKSIWSYGKNILSGIKMFTSGTISLQTLLTGIFSPTGLIILGIVAVAGAFIYAYKNSEEFREKVKKLVDALKNTLKPIMDVIIKVIDNVLRIGKEVLEKVIMPLITSILDTLIPILKTVIDVVTVILEKVINPVIDALSKVLIPIFNTIAWILENVVLPVVEAVTKAFTWILNNVLQPIFDGFDYFIEHYIKGIVDFVTGIFSGDWEKAWNGIKEIFTGIFEGLWETAKEILDKIIGKINDAWDDMKRLAKELSTGTETGATGIKGLAENWWGGVQRILGRKAEGGVFANGQWHDITTYATGGLPPVGQMFVARENGPEMVGKIGSHTAVMNNDQIVGSVSDGVYRAMLNANRGQNKGTQIYNIYLDEEHKIGTYTLEQLQNMAKTNGRAITIGG